MYRGSRCRYRAVAATVPILEIPVAEIRHVEGLDVATVRSCL